MATHMQDLQSEQSCSQNKKYLCEKCKDAEQIFYKRDGMMFAKRCECYTQKQNERRLARTPLANKKDEYTFEKYIANEDWQKGILEKAKTYTINPNGWFYIGGQVGAGKTHICTAITRNIACIKDFGFEYILFNQKMTELKQWKFEDKEKYEDNIYRLQNTDILFIDDLFKIEPTKADLDILFDIINARYLNNKIVIISSEKTAGELINVDEAIASRIIEKCGGNVISIGKDIKRNYRLKNINTV